MASTSAAESFLIPPGYVVHAERGARILVKHTPSLEPGAIDKGEKPVFINPIQEFNRDLSVCALRVWSLARQEEKHAEWANKRLKNKGANSKHNKKAKNGSGKKRQGDQLAAEAEQGDAKRLKRDDVPEATDAQAAASSEAVPTEQDAATSADVPADANGDASAVPAEASTSSVPLPAQAPAENGERPPPKVMFTAIEALSATGLRALRYAQEIPLLRWVIANDISADAVEIIKKNIELNGLHSPGAQQGESTDDAKYKGKVRPSRADACTALYALREQRVDCVDLDPYGTAAPFLDGAVQAVSDGGLLAVTCTDMGVLAGHNYPEKAYANYGGTCIKAEYCKEHALRLVIHAIAQSAARYGRYIVPLLSLSIDYYCRIFVRVYTSPKEVKNLSSSTALVYVCTGCQANVVQPLGRVSKKESANGQVNRSYHAATAHPGSSCSECDSRYHIGGPMWAGPLHDRAFVESMLAHVQNNKGDFGTATRLEGMLGLAREELEDAMYFFTPSRITGSFHCTPVPLVTMASALMNGGYGVSRSHAAPGSLKTDAPSAFIFDVVRAHIEANPVVKKNIKSGSPSARLQEKKRTHEVSFESNPAATALLAPDGKVRYQVNPTAYWGPQRIARRGAKGASAKAASA